MDENHATVLLGIAQLIGATLCVLLVRFIGKRPLVFISLAVCGICFASTAFYSSKYPYSTAITSNDTKIVYHQSSDYHANVTQPNEWLSLTNASVNKTLHANDERKPHTINKTAMKSTDNQFAWLPLVMLLGAALFTHIGIGLVPWMLIGEMYPTNIRSGSSSISIGLGYLFAFAANKSFLWMVKLLTLPGLFWFNTGISIGGCILIYFILPETEGRTLVEIERYFARKKSLPQ